MNVPTEETTNLLVEFAPLLTALFKVPLPPGLIEKVGPKLAAALKPKKTDRSPFRHHRQMMIMNGLDDRKFRTIIMNLVSDGRYEQLAGDLMEAFQIIGSETFPGKTE